MVRFTTSNTNKYLHTTAPLITSNSISIMYITQCHIQMSETINKIYGKQLNRMIFVNMFRT